jgi:hypothetical protein
LSSSSGADTVSAAHRRQLGEDVEIDRWQGCPVPTATFTP